MIELSDEMTQMNGMQICCLVFKM